MRRDPPPSSSRHVSREVFDSEVKRAFKKGRLFERNRLINAARAAAEDTPSAADALKVFEILAEDMDVHAIPTTDNS